MARYRVRAGDTVLGRAIADTTTTLKGVIRVDYDDGTTDEWFIPDFSITAASGSITFPSSRAFGKPGYIVGALIDAVSATPVQPGRVYAALWIAADDSSLKQQLCAGYVYGNHTPTLGHYEAPGEGPGWRRWDTGGFDVLGSTSGVSSMGASADHRSKFYGLVLYYNASADAATRTIAPSIIALGGILPTGFAGTGAVWVGPTLTLTASEEGVYYIYGNSGGSMVSTSDNGTMAYSSTATAPIPLPLIQTEEDSLSGAALPLNIASGHANDRYAWYILVETWVILL